MDTILWDEESDNYTRRAKDVSDKYLEIKEVLIADSVLDIQSSLKKVPEKILDIGCSFGITIQLMKEHFPSSDFYGIDPGKESIETAQNNNPETNIFFQQGHSHNLPYADNSFDVIILSMVLQWIPRKYLIKTIAEIDRVLKTDGIIYIQEFLPNKSITSVSRHNQDVFIFKDDYSSFFVTFPWLKEVSRKVEKIEEGEDQQRCTSIIRKYEIEDVYFFKNASKEKQYD